MFYLIRKHQPSGINMAIEKEALDVNGPWQAFGTTYGDRCLPS